MDISNSDLNLDIYDFEDNMYFVYIDSLVYNKIIMDEGI
jgi:hypothetical protein